MGLQLINPNGLPTPRSYTHVAVATGSRLLEHLLVPARTFRIATDSYVRG